MSLYYNLLNYCTSLASQKILFVATAFESCQIENETCRQCYKTSSKYKPTVTKLICLTEVILSAVIFKLDITVYTMDRADNAYLWK